MKRICSYCRKTIGEACGNCANPNPQVLLADPRVPGDPLEYKCPECGLKWEAGSDGTTHGVCLACMRLTQAERDRMAIEFHARRVSA